MRCNDESVSRSIVCLASVLWLDTESLSFNAEVRGLGQFEIRLLSARFTCGEEEWIKCWGLNGVFDPKMCRQCLSLASPPRASTSVNFAVKWNSYQSAVILFILPRKKLKLHLIRRNVPTLDYSQYVRISYHAEFNRSSNLWLELDIIS